MGTEKTQRAIEEERAYTAPNYQPLPVVLVSGEGSWLTDVEGRTYLDGLAGYSAVNFGHSNPRIIAVASEQMGKLAMTSRAFHSANLGTYTKKLSELADMDMALPMNTGAEAVESAIKAARKWGYQVKGVEENAAEIIVMEDNFHGRTTTVVSFSTDPDAYEDYGPFTPGFVTVPFGDTDAVREAINPNTVAVLVEPIQGEAGVVIPPEDYLPELRRLTEEQNVLLIADEIQSGFGRTGSTFACVRAGIKPDLYTLGKALGGGIYPASAVVGRRDVLGLLTPGTHGSTFGGNPLAAAIGTEVVAMMGEGTFQKNSELRGEQLGACLTRLQHEHPSVIGWVSRVGLWAGVQFNPDLVTGREVCEIMLSHRVLLKDAHGSIVRISPPLSSTEEDIQFLCQALSKTVEEISSRADANKLFKETE